VTYSRLGLTRLYHTEGELDALSAYQVLHVPVVSVHSASSARTDVGVDRPGAIRLKGSYLRLMQMKQDVKLHVRWQLVRLQQSLFIVPGGGQRKDANDYLVAGDADGLATLYQNARRYLPETIVSSFSEFDKILSEKIRHGILIRSLLLIHDLRHTDRRKCPHHRTRRCWQDGSHA